MHRTLLFLLTFVTGCTAMTENADYFKGPSVICTDSWYRALESTVPTGDGSGHGPDIGSEEWKSVVEFKLGIRGNAEVPRRDSEAWCTYIDERLTAAQNELTNTDQDRQPSFECNQVAPNSVESVICSDPELAGLDRTLTKVYSASSQIANGEQLEHLRAEQRGWIKGRDDCWKSSALAGCVKTEYRHRIAELKATYRLTESTGPFTFVCNEKDVPVQTLAAQDKREIDVTYFKTDPATLIANYDNYVSLMFKQPSASGEKYQGRNETFWQHRNEASVVWGHGADTLRCLKSP